MKIYFSIFARIVLVVDMFTSYTFVFLLR